MRSNKLFFLIFLVLYFVAGLSLLITGSVVHRHASQFSVITGYSLMSSAGLIIALGVLILILSVVGFLGALGNRLALLQFFIGTLFLILLLQLIAVIVAFTLREKAQDQLRRKLISSLLDYQKSAEVQNEWDKLQETWKCCGVNNSGDWIRHGDAYPPISCCNKRNSCDQKNATTLYSDGCYDPALNLYFGYSKALGGVSLFFFFVEIIGFILAIHLLRDLKKNYGSV